MTATATESFSAVSTVGFIVIFSILLRILFCGVVIYLVFLLIKALRKYLGERAVSQETASVRKSLGEAIKEYRMQCGMTQEFVAEQLGVSRQAVSKWENGTSDPSTSNLLALAKLYGIDAADLLMEVRESP